MRLKFLYPFTLLLFLTACGLNYSTIPTPINQSAERRKAISAHLIEIFAKDSAVYADMAWGKTKTVKPLSYKQLDSLYAIKYNLERQGKRNVDLEDEIKIQRQIALNDTAPILYIEDHMFSVTVGEKMSVYSSKIETDKNHTIRNAQINASNNLNSELLEEFKIYTFEESFINRGYAPEISERAFYIRYKKRADELTSSEEKDAFINHTLFVMQRARGARTLDTKELIEEVVRFKTINDKRFYMKNEEFKSMEEMVMKTEDGGTVVTGYQIQYTYQLDQNGTMTTYNYFIQLSSFMEVEKMALM